VVRNSTQFNDGFGHGVPFAMTAESVAQAGLAGLRPGETICIPGLENQPRCPQRPPGRRTC
jgi:hypothetical protein